MDVREILIYIGYVLLFINTVLYFISYKSKNFNYKILFSYLVFTFIIQIYSEGIAIKKGNNLFLSHYYFTGQFIIMSVFFYKTLINETIKKIICVVPFPVFILLFIQYFKNPEIYHNFNLFEILLTTVPIIGYCLFFLLERISSLEKKFIFFISGLFIYILCSTLIFSAGNISGDTQRILWRFNNSLYIIFQILIFIEWYKNFRKIELNRV